MTAFARTSLRPHRLVVMLIAGVSLPLSATTSFKGLDLHNSGNWTNGLPNSGNSGTVAVDGSLSTTVFGFGAGSEVDQTAGTLTADGTNGFNLTSGTWNLSSGAIHARYLLSNGSGTVINFSGGSIVLTDVSSTQHMGTANGGTLNISGPAMIDGTEATTGVYIDGAIDIASNWTGSWTWGTYSGGEWQAHFSSGQITYDGNQIDSGTFATAFVVTDGGKTLSPVTDSPVARFPDPADGTSHVPATTTLAWTAPTSYPPTAYEIYFGTDPEVRANPKTSVTSNSFDPPGDLAWSTTYHWVIDSLDGTTTHPGTAWSFTTEQDPATPFDPLADLALHNVVWDSPSIDSAGSMPIGNGDLAMNLWVEANGDLLLLLSKSDAWSDNGRLLKLGRVRISMSPNPFASGQAFLQTLNLPNGEILITAGADDDEVSFRIWADAGHPAIHIEATGQSPRDWQADLEVWRTTPRNFIDSGELNSAYGVRFDPTPPVIQPDTIVSGGTDKVTWYHRNTHSIWSDTLTVQALPHLIDELTDPLLDRTFGGTLYADSGFSNSSDTRLVSDAPRSSANFTIVALTAITPTAADWMSALDTEVAAVEATPLPQRYAEHASWWQAFWQRHWLSVTASGSGVAPGSDSYRVTQGYLLQRFVQASASRGAAPIKFNGSLFTVDATSDYDPDYRKWGPCFWWQNTRFPYWTMPMCGDFELMDPLFKMYLDALPLARERVQTYYGHPGAYFPETMYFWGTWNNDNYGWDRSTLPDGRSENSYIRWEWQSGIELISMMLLRYNTSPDEAFANTTLVPLAQDLIDLYDHRYPRDPDGKLRLTPGQALETYWENTENPTPEIAGLSQVLTGLLELPTHLTSADQRTQWTRLLGELPPLPLRSVSGKNAISPAGLIDGGIRNSESPELYPVFPYAHYHVGKPDLDLADWTYQTRVNKTTNGWSQDAIFAAMLGRSAEAKSEVTRRFKTKHSGSRFPAIWGPNYDWVPDQCHGGATMIALQKMLLMEDGDRILLFPSWPADWDLNFRIHARGNTTIEGRLKNGEITKFQISPPERRADVETFLGTLPPQSDSWDQWRLNTPGAGGGVDDNGDHDGFVDLLEYALGGDPANSASPDGLVIDNTDTGTTIHYDRPIGLSDITYSVETSPDLASDSWIPEPADPTVTPLGESRERVSYSLPPSVDPGFYRLSVELLQ